MNDDWFDEWIDEYKTCSGVSMTAGQWKSTTFIIFVIFHMPCLPVTNSPHHLVSKQVLFYRGYSLYWLKIKIYFSFVAALIPRSFFKV